MSRCIQNHHSIIFNFCRNFMIMDEEILKSVGKASEPFGFEVAPFRVGDYNQGLANKEAKTNNCNPKIISCFSIR